DGFKRDEGDYDTPKGRQLNSFVDANGLSGGASYIWKDGFVGLAYSEYNSFYGIPGKDAADERPRIDLGQQKLQAKGEWRVNDYGLEAIRFWFGSSNYAHNEIDFNQDEHKDEIGSRFTNQENEARFEVEHTPVILTFGKLSGAIGAQWDDRDTRGE